jgi:hypothetical protein
MLRHNFVKLSGILSHHLCHRASAVIRWCLLRPLSIPGVVEFISIMIVESYVNGADTILSLREKNIQNLGEMSWDGEDGLKSQEQLYHIATVSSLPFSITMESCFGLRRTVVGSTNPKYRITDIEFDRLSLLMQLKGLIDQRFECPPNAMSWSLPKRRAATVWEFAAREESQEAFATRTPSNHSRASNSRLGVGQQDT